VGSVTKQILILKNFLNVFLKQFCLEEKGSKVFSIDSTTDLGLRVTGLGGIVSLLRFAINN